METSFIRFPVKCPCCGQESLVASSLDKIRDILATKQQLKLFSNCAYHRAMWIANAIERHQIREYAAAIDFSMAEPLLHQQRYG